MPPFPTVPLVRRVFCADRKQVRILELVTGPRRASSPFPFESNGLPKQAAIEAYRPTSGKHSGSRRARRKTQAQGGMKFTHLLALNISRFHPPFVWFACPFALCCSGRRGARNAFRRCRALIGNFVRQVEHTGTGAQKMERQTEQTYPISTMFLWQKHAAR